MNVVDSTPGDSPFRALQAVGRIGDRSAPPTTSPTPPNTSADDLAAWVSGTTVAVTGGLPQ